MDCTFKTDCGVFNYRVGAIILLEGHIVMAKNLRDPYYYSVGGRVHLHETAEQAVLRETFEETGIHFEIDRLGFIHENFFTPGSVPFHELSLYYYMKDLPMARSKCSTHTDQGAFEKLEWLPLDSLDDYTLYPEFFKTELKQPSKEIKHILTIQ